MVKNRTVRDSKVSSGCYHLGLFQCGIASGFPILPLFRHGMNAALRQGTTAVCSSFISMWHRARPVDLHSNFAMWKCVSLQCPHSLGEGKRASQSRKYWLFMSQKSDKSDNTSSKKSSVCGAAFLSRVQMVWGDIDMWDVAWLFAKNHIKQVMNGYQNVSIPCDSAGLKNLPALLM